MEKTEKTEKAKERKDLGAKRIIRIFSTDIDGDLSLINALRRIKGIGFMFANAVCLSTNVDRQKKIGELGEDEIRTIEAFIRNPEVPAWMLNRRKDPESGTDMHITKTDIDLLKREDINALRRMRAYRGVRHELGQPVRGQRTRSSFRTQRSVGVTKKSLRQAPAAPKQGKAEKK